MTFSVSAVKNENEFDELCPMAYDAWKEPYNPQLKHFQPTIENRDEAIAEMKSRYVGRMRERPDSKWWVKVVDLTTNTPVGLACWSVEEATDTNNTTVASWHPEGSVERRFAERFINGLHAFLNARLRGSYLGTDLTNFPDARVLT